MMKNTLTALLLVGMGVLVQGCASDIGEACATRGSTDECVEGSVCDLKGTSDAEPVCLKICEDANDCSGTEDCNGVSGSNLKACTPKK